MKKKALSLALALVMCLGLTVPAFAASGDYSANGYTDPTAENVVFSVAPIGVATIRSGEPRWDEATDDTYFDYVEYTAYVFDQDCLVTRKDGRPMTSYILQPIGDTGYLVGIGDKNFPYTKIDVAGISADSDDLFTFAPDETSDGETDWSPWMMSKDFLDEFPILFGDAVVGTVVEYRPLSAQPSQPTAPSFSDVKADAFYAEPVAWAVEKGVTAGTSATTFSPDATCTQGQILTFLWRAKGEPKPAGAVSGTQYYAVAAQWAKEQGLTDNFSAEADCTRSMVVTYLWKLAGSPKTGASHFSDVSANAAYAQAVAWAVEQGITSGTSATTFSPDATCTRGQIVTFLYRAFVK